MTAYPGDTHDWEKLEDGCLYAERRPDGTVDHGGCISGRTAWLHTDYSRTLPLTTWGVRGRLIPEFLAENPRAVVIATGIKTTEEMRVAIEAHNKALEAQPGERHQWTDLVDGCLYMDMVKGHKHIYYAAVLGGRSAWIGDTNEVKTTAYWNNFRRASGYASTTAKVVASRLLSIQDVTNARKEHNERLRPALRGL